MAPRSDDDVPRRGSQPRRGTSHDQPAEGDENRAGRARRFGIGDARAYTPRGRTVAERGRPERDRGTTGRDTDRGTPDRGGSDREAPERRTPERRTPERDAGRRGAPDPQTGERTRSRTVANRDQRTRSPRAGRTADPFRPALQVLDGGRQAARKGRPAEPDDDVDLPQRAGRRQRAAGGGRGGSGRVGSGRTGNRKQQERRTVTGPRVSRAVRAVATEPPKLANSTRRLRLGTVLALALFVTIGIRLVTLQVAKSPEELKKLLALRDSRVSTVALLAPRGAILDRNGAVLAHSVESREISVDPETVEDPKKTADALAPLIGRPVSEILPLIRKHPRWAGGPASRFEYLKHGVDVSVGQKIKKLNLPGVIVTKDERRDYPGVDLAANIIGFVGSDGYGLAGLEARYDMTLRGTPGQHRYEHGRDTDNPIPGGFDSYRPPQAGTSIQLTLDQDLQFMIQRLLKQYNEEKHATLGGAVVIDVRTGEVVAQASYPPYNPGPGTDHAVGDGQDVPSGLVADPGSVHKAIVFGAALQEGKITPDSTIKIGPAIDVAGVPFADSHRQPAGTEMTMAGLLAYSSNVGTILVSRRIGPQKLYEYQQKFGLGQPVKEGVAGEVPGKLIPPDQWSGSGYGSIPIGMSVDATLVQMAGVYATIANDGTYVQPHIIKSYVSGQDGATSPGPAPVTRQVLSPEVARQLRAMMEGVITGDHATGTKAGVPGYRVSGKTGTGQRLVDGKYLHSNYDTFIGMAPAENPRYVVAVSADVPTGAAGDVVAPAFSDMMAYTLYHYGVPPSATPSPPVKFKP